MPPGPPPATGRRSAESHAAILAATVALLEEVGYRGLTIEGVARRAGVGKQTIYRWWDGSKAALVMEAFTDVGDDRVVPPDTGDVRADLLGILEPVFALHTGFREGTALANKTLMAEAQLDEGFHHRYAALHRDWRGPMRDAVARGIARGELRQRPTRTWWSTSCSGRPGTGSCWSTPRSIARRRRSSSTPSSTAVAADRRARR